WLYCRAKKLDFLRLADLGAAGLAIGTAVGRIGDLVIGDHLGRTTDGFWGWEYKGGELISSPPCDPAVYPSPTGCIEPGMVVHQTALYDSIWALVIFFVLIRLERKPHPKGFLVFTWAAMYSVGRILTDLTRVDKTWFGTGLTGSQLTAITALVLALFFLVRLRKAPRLPAVTPGTKATGAARWPEEAEAPGEDGLPEAENAGAEEPDLPAETEIAETPEHDSAVEAEDREEVAAAPPLEAEPIVPVEPVDPEAAEAAAPVGAAKPDADEVAPTTDAAASTPEATAAADAADEVVVQASAPAASPGDEIPADPADTADAVEAEAEPGAQQPSEAALAPETPQPDGEDPEERQEP
ncbi:MAG: prolipoprotein diacylglyceryl transferase family protein, partial [Actinomycetota bacterium]